MIARIEATGAISNGANPGVHTVPLSITTVLGELVVVEVFTSGANGAQPASVTDNLSQVYTLIYGTTGITSGHSGTWLYYKQNSAAGVTQIVTTEQAGDTFGCTLVAHYTGLLAANALDQNGGNPASGGTTTWASAAVTTTQAYELLIGTVLGQSTSAQAQASPSGLWTPAFQLYSTLNPNFDGNNGQYAALVDQIVTTLQVNVMNTGTVTAPVNFNFPGIATFRGFGSPPGSVLAPLSVSPQLRAG